MPKLLKHKYFMGYALSGGFAMAGMFAYITSSPFVFIDTFHLSVEKLWDTVCANAVVFCTLGTDKCKDSKQNRLIDNIWHGDGDASTLWRSYVFGYTV